MMKFPIVRVLFFLDLLLGRASSFASLWAKSGGSMVEYDGSRIPDCFNFIDPVSKQPFYHKHSSSNNNNHTIYWTKLCSDCSRFWECGPESGVRYQYPDGPVCDWPSNVDCDYDGDEHHFVSIESTTTPPSKTTQTPSETTSSKTSTSLASTWPPWVNPGEGCLEYDNSQVPNCTEFINPDAREPYYHSHSTSNTRTYFEIILYLSFFFQIAADFGNVALIMKPVF